MSTTLSVSSSLPVRNPLSSASTQSWLNWAVSKEFKVGAAVVIGSLFAYLLYRYAIQEKPFQRFHPGGLTSEYCFIQIDPQLVPKGEVDDLKVIVEDTEERRIAVQYFNDFREKFHLVTRLPPKTDVRVRLDGFEVSTVPESIGGHIGTSKIFQVDQESAKLLQITDFSSDVVSQKLTKIDEKANSWSAGESLQQRPLKDISLRFDLSKTGNEFVPGENSRVRGLYTFELIGEEGIYKAVQIIVRLLTDGRIFALEFPVIDGEVKRLDIGNFINTFKEQYKPQPDEPRLKISENLLYLVGIDSQSFQLPK